MTTTNRFVLSGIVIGLFAACQTSSTEAPLFKLSQEINALFEETSGDFAIAFRLLNDTTQTILINERESFHAASTMKTPVMIEVFKQAGEGEFSLRDSIPVTNEFTSIVDGSTFSMDLGSDSQEELYDRIGRQASIYDLTYQMIIKSSNLATNILIERVGAKAVTQTMRDLGAVDIQVLRGVEDQKAFDAGMSNTTTAYDLMVILEAISKGNAVNADASGQMLKILGDQYFKDLIPKYLPQQVKVAHKTGSITGVQHDSAIVELPDGNRYVLVLLSKNLTDVAAGKETIAQVSKLVYEYVSSLNL
ncbi:MAG: serine hydrolase [Lunatimonas sp.]|uniref:serine hydrolase n=1 Tax=Lunatimonas sp. TaxID=2060141 RepID=UPI00263ABB60|nr:serine hydrolase [Lunatimonas sp.]MCC5938312.1 serine hydrolase [Lunatimonas sp.]